MLELETLSFSTARRHYTSENLLRRSTHQPGGENEPLIEGTHFALRRVLFFDDYDTCVAKEESSIGPIGVLRNSRIAKSDRSTTGAKK